MNNQPGFGGSTFSFMWTTDALSAMRAMLPLGVNDFDIIMAPGHFWPDTIPVGDRARLAATLRAEGIRVESLNYPALDQNIASCIPEARAYSVGLYTQAMELGHEIGAKAIVVVPGRVSGLWPPPQAQSEGWLRDGLEKLLAVAEQLDQRIFIESHPQTPIPDVAKIASFMNRLDHSRLQVAYDVSNAEFISENQPEAIRTLGRRIGQVHLSDGTRTRWRHDCVGMGTVDFTGIAGALDEIGFAGTRLLEIISTEPLRDIAASARALRAIIPGHR